jgi:amidase
MNAYLATTPATVSSRTLADLIAFNKAHAGSEMALFGQETFEKAQRTKGLADPAYAKARQISLAAAGANGIDKMMREHRLDALVGPTMPAAWKTDAVHGDQISGGGAGSLAAVAGYPHLTVPMGQVKGLPVGLSFIGGKWDDARILSLAYEQARGPIPGPSFWRSIEDSPDIAPLLEPAR